MGNASTYLANKALDHVFGRSVYFGTTVYLALSTADPLADGSGLAEPADAAYARKVINFKAPVDDSAVQDGRITFATATASWGTISHFALMDAATSGNLLAFGQITTPKTIVSGDTYTLSDGNITITISGTELGGKGGPTYYLAQNLLNLFFRQSGYTPPTIYVALLETDVAYSDTSGANLDELDMTGYAREAHSVWTTAAAGANANTGTIDFGTLTGTSETITATCLVDAATNGNILMFENDITFTVESGEQVRIVDGAYTVDIS